MISGEFDGESFDAAQFYGDPCVSGHHDWTRRETADAVRECSRCGEVEDAPIPVTFAVASIRAELADWGARMNVGLDDVNRIERIHRLLDAIERAAETTGEGS